MSAITKERIELFIKNPLDNGLTRGEQMELAWIALASLESMAAPVVPYDAATAIRACLDEFPEGARDIVEECAAIAENTCRADNPSPAYVPDEMTPKQASRSYCGEVRGYRDGWNACRAAMLQCYEPVTDNTNQQFESLSRGDK